MTTISKERLEEIATRRGNVILRAAEAISIVSELMALREAAKPFARVAEIPERFGPDEIVGASIDYTMDADEVESLDRLSGGALLSDRASLIVSMDGLKVSDFRRLSALLKDATNVG